MVDGYKGACHKFPIYGYLKYHDRETYLGLAVELS